MKEFERLGIIKPVLKTIEEARFQKPSEIQEKTIPLILEGKDVIAGSATGSGKTLAFGSGVIQKAERGKGIQALILTPTRELVEQVSGALRKFSKYKSLKISAVYGGVAINPQIWELKTADIVVGTPGRMLDHLQRQTINLEYVKILVLDEADRMLDMGFIDDVQKIIGECPGKRQTLLFSATISPDIAHISRKYMRDAVEISAEEYVDPKKLMQIFYDVPDHMKFSLLVHLLKSAQAGLAMVFCNTQRNTDFVAKNLKFSGINALAIHGGFSQAKRTRTMQDFHSKNFQVLVCTDVAARGLDIKGVSHIYNYDTPDESKAYIHRIGRTARAGKDGIAISIVASRDYDNFSRVINDNEVKIDNKELPKFKRVMIRWKESPRSSRGRFGSNGGRSGSRYAGRSGSGGRSSGGFRRNSNGGGRSNGGRSDNRGGRSNRSFGKSRRY